MKRNARIKQRQEFVIAIALLCGAEVERVPLPRVNEYEWRVTGRGGEWRSHYSKVHACEMWLRVFAGIGISAKCEVVDLNTKDAQS